MANNRNPQNNANTPNSTQTKAPGSWASRASGKPSNAEFPALSSTLATKAPSSQQGEMATAAVGGKNAHVPHPSLSSTTSSVPSSAPASNTVTSTTSAMASLSLGDQKATSNGAAKPNNQGQKSGGSSDRKEEGPKFSDATYASSDALGVAGDRLTVRVNRFKIQPKHLAVSSHFYIYPITLPTIRGITVTNPTVKRIMISTILRTPALAPAATQNRIFTDWNSELITMQPLPVPSDAEFDDDDGAWIIKFDFQNQTSHQPDQMEAKIGKPMVLEYAKFEKYCKGQTEGNFNYGLYVKVFNVMVRHFAAQNAIVVGSSKIFQTQNQQQSLVSGLYPRLGLHNSVRPARNGVQLQLNSSTSAFFPSVDLTAFLTNYFGGHFNLNPTTPGARANLDALVPEMQAILRQVQVGYKYDSPDPANSARRSPVHADGSRGRRKRISELGSSASTQTFDLPNGDTRTVEEHFNNYVLQRPLRHPDLPAVNVGNGAHKTWVPMELLWIAPHQCHRSKVPDRDMRGNPPQHPSMPQVSRRDPRDNVQRIENQGLQLIQRQNLSANQIIEISPQMMKVVGRMLKLPQLLCNTALTAADDKIRANGKWNMEGKKFQAPRSLDKLRVMVVGSRNPPQVTPQTLLPLQTELARLGVYCDGKPEVQYAPNVASQTLEEARRRFSAPPKLILVIMDGELLTYSQIKRWGDLESGGNTVCLKYSNVRKLGDAGFNANLALKINVKLNGQNFRLADSFLNSQLHVGGLTTMVVGADVVHPGGASVNYCPSIASVVASVDRDCVRFPGSMRLQEGRREDIQDMHGMMLERLSLWYAANRQQLPGRILFYRDGVSEDQFSVVKRDEIRAIESACEAAALQFNQPGYKPPITAIVCTKRHQTRFYPVNDKNEPFKFFDKNGRFRPGLVVDDHSIRLPKYVDFWLQAHQPLQGTGRPCHYFVLQNDSNMTPDQLQQLTYGLSWVYATSLTPVSLVAPAYYADKLCERGRRWMLAFFAGRHHDRHRALQMVNGVRATHAPYHQMNDPQRKAARAAVAQHIATATPSPWPRNGNANPCIPSVMNTMFYV